MRWFISSSGATASVEILHFVRMCETTVYGSTRLTTNGVVSLEIEYLSVRPETCMRDVELYRECSIRVQWLKSISRWTKEALRWEAKRSSLAITTCLPDSMWTRKVSRSLLPTIRDC